MPTDCDQITTLDCLRALYNFNYTLAVPDQHSIGIGASIPKACVVSVWVLTVFWQWNLAWKP